MAAPVVQIVDANATARDAISAQAAALAVTQVQAVSDWYDTAAITTFAETTASVMESLQRNMARLTDAYLSRLSTAIRGRPVRPVGIVDVAAGLRQNITHAGAYGRLADQYRYDISTGMDRGQALDRIAIRSQVIAGDDVNLAMRDQAQKFMVVHQFDGWRRIIHPELSRGGTCGLCVAASDRTYYVEDLMPLHARCNCTVAPIINGNDPGQDLTADDLRRLYDEAGSTNRRDLSKVRYRVEQHAELGPQLVFAADHVETAGDAAALTRTAA